ncbi:MAG TPA: hypothetical protein PKL29_07375 [Methanothrix sp.]|nr:hypothetical protein [Methanothrix sp.]
MSINHKFMLLLLAISVLSIPVLAEGNYTVNVTTDKFLGDHLVNQSGFALYYFADDGSGTGGSTCYDDCAARWPSFYAEIMAVPDSLRSVDFDTIVRTDGSRQTTFKGWPLYLYSGDEAPGDVYGNDRDDGRWHVVNPFDQPQLM